ncbi:MAG: Ig-like domain-containing protein, partial [Sneathiella sp.]|uniref:Ig-like domain-containing protein n=1 Tax=Sneathiella sp. TaxID=1964365 RepID=UPI0030039287
AIWVPHYVNILQEKEGGDDILQLGAGITLDDLAFELIGNDLYIGIRNESDTGTTASQLLDHVQIIDWTDNKNTIEHITLNDGRSIKIEDIATFTQATAGADTLDTTGSATNHLITGFEGDDSITTGSGDDLLIGGAGNDTLTGGAGDDTLVGGEGDDAARYSASFAEYNVLKDALTGNWSIEHLNSGSDGIDDLSGIAQFEFADGVMDGNGFFTAAIEGGLINVPIDAVASGILSKGYGQNVGSLVYDMKEGPTNGSVTVNPDGSYSYTPDASFSGSDSFTYRFVDENGDITIGEMTVEVFDPTVNATIQQVNTSISQQQRYSSVAVLDDGSYVVVWNSMHSGAEIYGQRYDGQGGALGSEFLVNTYTSGTQSYPAVAGLDDGGFVVVYAGSQDPSYGIYGQRYDSSGVAVGAEFHANTYTSNAQYEPDVTGLAGGGFVVAWYSTSQDGSSQGAYGQAYDALGNMVGTELRFNTTTSGSQNNPNLTGLAGGGFVAVWDSAGALDGSGTGVFAQLYTSLGVAVGGEFQINTYYSSTQREPSVAMLQNGGFVVTWESYAQDGSNYGVFGQRFDASGQMIGAEFQANTYTTSLQRYSDVVGLTGGGFVAVWASNGQDGSSYGIFGQEYDASGAVVGTEFQVNDYTTSSQHHPSIAALTDGGFIITWTSVSGDGSSEGVFSRIYGAADRVSIGTSGDDILIGHDGNEILEGGYGADVLEGGVGDDTISGGQGADSYIFTRGDGQDVIDDNASDGASDTLVLDTGIDHDQLWFEQTGDDLLISVIGTSDQITVENWYAAADNKIEGIETSDGQVTDITGVEALVSAMASFSPPGGGETDLSDPTYDPLDSVLAANWQTPV